MRGNFVMFFSFSRISKKPLNLTKFFFLLRTEWDLGYSHLLMLVKSLRTTHTLRTRVEIGASVLGLAEQILAIRIHLSFLKMIISSASKKHFKRIFGYIVVTPLHPNSDWL